MDKKERAAVIFSKHLGKLFYAIALSDKKIKREEFSMMKKELCKLLIDENFVAFNSDVDIEHHVTSTFTLLYFEKELAQTCFDDFITYKQTHESIFSEKLKKSILEIAGKIASSFSNCNKSELMMLAKLSIEFKK